MTDGDPGFGVYIHWPFCQAKCPYCDFNSHVRHKAIDQDRFAAAFVREIKTVAARTGPRRVSSVFLGGGTPSLMAPQTVDAILSAIGSAWTLEADAEVTLEANPSSVEADRFRGYRSAGVNRLSLGVQSLRDADLRFLGRLHDAESALRAIETARAVFPRLSFDLIYARPGQDMEAWSAELNEAIDRAADHLSLYQLTIEMETRFYDLAEAGKLAMPTADEAATLFERTQEICEGRGLPAYETSNHARPGAESRHNLIYWRMGDYAGIGPGAHGRLSVQDGRFATANEKHPETWLEAVERDGVAFVDDYRLGSEEQGDEYLLMGLRLAEGVDLDRYESYGGRPLDRDRIADLLKHGMVEEIGPSRLRTTPAGALVLDAVVADLAA
ncbi:MAG: radical SAM family heme chaperone HemW [Pseudomonadota bacterium]